MRSHDDLVTMHELHTALRGIENEIYMLHVRVQLYGFALLVCMAILAGWGDTVVDWWRSL